MNRIVCKHHLDSVVPVWDSDIEGELEAGTELYRLTDWPVLLKRCDCPDAPPPPDVYEPLTSDEAREWVESNLA